MKRHTHCCLLKTACQVCVLIAPESRASKEILASLPKVPLSVHAVFCYFSLLMSLRLVTKTSLCDFDISDSYIFIGRINPFMPNWISHRYQLDESISNLRVIWK